MTGKQHTDFKFLARHEDLRIGNDGGRLAELEPVGCVEGRARVKRKRKSVFQITAQRPRSHSLHTLVVDTKQPAFLCVTTETDQHLIGCAAG